MNDERYVLRNARALAESYLRASVRAGDSVIDATMGNGGDTRLLCRLVGPDGHVTAFDVQPEALRSTKAKLEEEGLLERASLILSGHEAMEAYVSGPVQAVVFNFGWLPGADHTVTTRCETSLRAAEAALRLLSPGGIVTLCIYPGHEEGARELEALARWSSALPVREFNVLRHQFINAADSTPNLILIQKNAQSGTERSRGTDGPARKAAEFVPGC